MLTDIGFELLSTLAFGVVGVVLLALGYVLIDLLTPGKLGKQVFVEHNRDAAFVLASAFGAVGMIVATAIWTSGSDLALGLLGTFLYGIIGLVLLGVAYLVIDLLTPGSLGELLTDDKQDPAVWVTVAANLAVGLIVAASLT